MSRLQSRRHKGMRRHLKNNRLEGPVTFYYENGMVKSVGQYAHCKKPIGKWNYYAMKGNLVHTMTYTR